MIISATPIASCTNGIGIRAAADCRNNITTCFRWLDLLCCLKRFSDDFWMCVRENWPNIWIDPHNSPWLFAETIANYGRSKHFGVHNSLSDDSVIDFWATENGASSVSQASNSFGSHLSPSPSKWERIVQDIDDVTWLQWPNNHSSMTSGLGCLSWFVTGVRGIYCIIQVVGMERWATASDYRFSLGPPVIPSWYIRHLDGKKGVRNLPVGATRSIFNVKRVNLHKGLWDGRLREINEATPVGPVSQVFGVPDHTSLILRLP